MKLFSCICGVTSSLFFESTQCTTCGRLTGYCQDIKAVIGFDKTEVDGEYTSTVNGKSYRQCDNYSLHQTCNGMVPADSIEADVLPNQMLCFSCHFNDNIPNLSVPGHINLWRKLEVAKRRTLLTLDALNLPLLDKQEDPEMGLSFDFLADKQVNDHFATPLDGHEPVFTGHNNGHITINIAEADDVARASTRLAMGERYRTLLGHFRHEIGHYYWDLLVSRQTAECKRFRALFGDERESYQDALDHHYQHGAPENWQDNFISQYASMHPWEDFAETWSHYMHMIDTLETAQTFGLQITTNNHSNDNTDMTELSLPQAINYFDKKSSLLDMIETWVRFSVILNSLNRSMGLPDAYPFVFNEVIEKKLRYIHYLIHSSASQKKVKQPHDKAALKH
ncbi:putative zinc-binding metallopeptidase [Neptunomonas sp.]|uniref:zinc-binding metallopeptidase family protein n=1 Tax=Neptunomonas sp. TaxID=1971898 RepID=UPI003562724B